MSIELKLFYTATKIVPCVLQNKAVTSNLQETLPQIEQKFCNCLTDHMLQHDFHDRQELASALNLKPTEMGEMHPSDLAARLFNYCAVNRISLDSVIMQMAK